MYVAGRVTPKIRAEDYEEFHGLISGLPATHKAWQGLERVAACRRAEGAVTITPEQLRDHLPGSRGFFTMAELYSYAEAIWRSRG